MAEAGHRVRVLEAAARPGGAVGSAELTLPGFVHDTCSGFFPLAAVSPALGGLGLALEWVNPPVAMAHVLDEGGAEIALHRDLGATERSLEACATGAGAGWGSLVRTLWPHRHALIDAALGRLPPYAASARLLAGLGRRAVPLAALAPRSSAAIGRRLFGGDRRATAWLAGSGAHADLSPRVAGSGAFGLGLNFLAHVAGWPFPRGGAGRLVEALLAQLGECGGEVRCGAPVQEIELRGRRVAAVRLAGERLAADAVICTASPGPLTAMLSRGVLPARVERRLTGWRYGLGTLKLDYALAGPVPWNGPSARRAGVVHVGGDLHELQVSLEQALEGRFPHRPALVVGQQSLHDPSRAPSGRHTLYVYARVPQRSGLSDAEMAERVERQLERFAPGFRALVLARAVRSPAGLEAENPSMRGGDLASGSCALRQQLVLRPAPSLCRGRTPVGGLYVAGAWLHPGPGVHGASGRAAADALIADARRGLHRDRAHDR